MLQCDQLQILFFPIIPLKNKNKKTHLSGTTIQDLNAKGHRSFFPIISVLVVIFLCEQMLDRQII